MLVPPRCITDSYHVTQPTEASSRGVMLTMTIFLVSDLIIKKHFQTLSYLEITIRYG